MKEFKPCRVCQSKQKENTRVPPGFIRTGTMESGFKYKECNCHKKWSQYRDVYLKSKGRGFNLNILDNIDDYVYRGVKSIDAVNKLKSSWPHSNIVYIYGPNGTQKTTTAQLLAFEQIKNNKSCYFILMSRLVDLLMKASSFNADEETLTKLNKINNSDIVFIDEAFDSEKMTIFKSGWKTPFLDSFLRECLNSNIQLVFISNIEPELISEEKFSKSIKDLVLRESINNRFKLEDRFIDEMEKWDGGSLF